MNKIITQSIVSVALVVFMAMSVWAQTPSRVGNDVYWARGLDGATITLDGDLSEAAWSMAEVIDIRYGERSALPTSGWRAEFQETVYNDPLVATVRLLVDNDANQLYMSVEAQDSSVGGIASWARWDGLLMSIKDHTARSSVGTTEAREYFYTFWYNNVDSLVAPGVPPMFRGYYGNNQDTSRTADQVRAWDGAFTVLNGTSNDDAAPDEGYIMEMRMDLDTLGYNAANPTGDVIELNFSIWDGDWLHSGDPGRIAVSRTSWQSPWNGNNDNVGRVHVHPSVTINSGELPDVEPDIRIPNGATRTAPVIDGVLDEEMWDFAYTFDIAWGDSLLRDSYPGVGKWRSGQFQPQVNGNPRPPILDPSQATIKMFFRDNFLYFGADVSDQVVQGTSVEAQWDAVRFMLMHRDSVNADNELEFYKFTASFDSAGTMVANEILPVLVLDGTATLGSTLKGATTVNDNTDIDEGYVIELEIDLTALGYATDLGDHLLFGGVTLFDGDSFDDPLSDYGSRTWWFRENDWGQSTPWMVMDETLTGIDSDEPVIVADRIELHGNYPNPFNPSTTISYTVPFNADVTLQVYNLLGQRVVRKNIEKVPTGGHTIVFEAANLASGIYFYQIEAVNLATGKLLRSEASRMVLLK